VQIEELKNIAGLVSGVGEGAETVLESEGQGDWSEAAPVPPNSAEAIEQLASVFAAYNETTNRMRLAHQRLKEEVGRLRGELQQKNEQLERQDRLAALGQMAAGIAHEIRNPLGGIQLYASLLERDLSEQGEQMELAGKISKGVKSLDLIVNDILAFTQDQNCHKCEMHFSGLLGEVLDYVQPHIAESEIEIDASEVDDGLTVQIDVNMMRRVLLNLLLNAVDVLDGGGLIAVKAAEVEKETVFSSRIDIADNGRGIAESVKHKMFDPFFTTKDTGTGLGLTIAHRLVECHGGQIFVANNRWGGATFSIFLP